MTHIIPQSKLDLLEGPVVVTLVTLNPDGHPQATPVWCSYDGTHIWINSDKGRRKDRNMKRDSRVTICALDPDNPYRYLEVRGVVEEITEEGGAAHINMLSKQYFGRDDFYNGDEARRARETRVIFKIKPLQAH